MNLYNCCFTYLPKLFQVIYIHEAHKDVGRWLRLREKILKLGLRGPGCKPSLEALQIHEGIMRLHQRQSLHGGGRSGTLQPQRYFARYQLEALLPIARCSGFHTLRENLLQDEVSGSTNLVTLGLQELGLLQVMIPLPLGLCTDHYTNKQLAHNADPSQGPLRQEKYRP